MPKPRKEEPKKCAYNVFQQANFHRVMIGLPRLSSFVVPPTIPYPEDTFTPLHYSTTTWTVYGSLDIPNTFSFVIRVSKATLNRYPSNSAPTYYLYSSLCGTQASFNLYSYYNSKFGSSIMSNSFFRAEMYYVDNASGFRSPSRFSLIYIFP
jgi:hypothetical protein